MLRADHTYQRHALEDIFTQARWRGAGIELRLHGCDPDQAEAAARRRCYPVLVGATDSAQGLREACVMDGEGYVWVPDVPSRSQA